AISGLEAILKLEPDSTATKELLFVCKSKQELQEANKHNLLVPGTKAGERKTAEVNGVEFAFRWCPPGVFLMGSPESEDGHKDDEKQHEVTLTKGFWIMETPVTQKQWMAVMDNNPSECKGDNLPVEDVSWYDCYDFCKKCVQLGLPLQLPTEAQWEYACRAGSTGAYAGELQEMRFSSSYNRTIYPVGIKKPNAWGIYDMYGNVHNWCTDWYGEYLSERVTDPTGPSHPAKGFEGHVFRGGSMFSSTSANREHGMVDNGIETSWESDYQILGFRCIVKEETLKAGERKTYEVNGVEIAFRWAPAGSFLMGSPESEEGRKDDETQHEVTLTNGFWMMETPVTVGMFKAFVDDTGYESDGYAPRYWNGREWEDNPELSWLSPGFDQNDNHPVTCVSSYDAEEFCKWLSHKTGEYIQLPTEAQWEYACRAGSTGVCAIILDEMAWYRFNSGYTTHPAGLKMPNAWGLYDMHGNVYEWCVDYYSSLSSESEIDPQDCFAHDSQVVRGGSWISKNKDCRSASRNKFPLKTRIYFLGFRCVKGR
ncbi:MAG: SUMF1/EgtB/PvdO family nonheme iron enzyme, partial [Thermoguttaceae bacterium]|nr:SUMF1/EgtB/PvdO family nonheme iron enzyme [Thermoguttaceae bacterium]